MVILATCPTDYQLAFAAIATNATHTQLLAKTTQHCTAQPLAGQLKIGYVTHCPMRRALLAKLARRGPQLIIAALISAVNRLTFLVRRPHACAPIGQPALKLNHWAHLMDNICYIYGYRLKCQTLRPSRLGIATFCLWAYAH